MQIFLLLANWFALIVPLGELLVIEVEANEICKGSKLDNYYSSQFNVFQTYWLLIENNCSSRFKHLFKRYVHVTRLIVMAIIIENWMIIIHHDSKVIGNMGLIRWYLVII